MRDLTLGLEVVLPDGRVIEALRGLRKDNTGYDLRHLFVGAEGTLGVITAATLKLFPRARQTETALLGLSRLDDVMALFARSRDASGDQLTGFELMSRFCIEMAMEYTPGVRDPLDSQHPWYVLVEMSSSQAGTGLRPAMEQILEDAMGANEVQDGVIAASDAQRRELWRVREAMIMGIRHQGPAVKHDISVPVSQVARFITNADAAVLQAYPTSRTLSFGHVGDGNIHYNAFDVPQADMPSCQRMINDIVIGLGGSISAEHGIGLSKREELMRYRSDTELDVMRRIKKALDPAWIMNPENSCIHSGRRCDETIYALARRPRAVQFYQFRLVAYFFMLRSSTRSGSFLQRVNEFFREFAIRHAQPRPQRGELGLVSCTRPSTTTPRRSSLKPDRCARCFSLVVSLQALRAAARSFAEATRSAFITRSTMRSTCESGIRARESLRNLAITS